MSDFIDFKPYPNMEFGSGDAILPDGRSVPVYSPEIASRFIKPQQLEIGPAQIEKPGAPVSNGKPYEAEASNFLKSSGGKLGATATTSDGKQMVVETHPAAPERGLATEHPGVTVREPTENTPPGKISAEENQALDDLISKYPKLTKQGLLSMFQHEGGYDPEVGLNPGAVNPKSGASGIFQLMPSQQKNLGIGDITKYSAADQIKLYDEYLKSHGASGDITDADLGLAQAAPGFIGKPDTTLVYSAGSKEAANNPAWQDANGNVTVGSIKAYYGGHGGSTSTASIQDLGAGNKLVTESKTLRREEEGIPYTSADQAALFQRSSEHAQALKDAYAPLIDAQSTLEKQQIARQQEIQAAADLAASREQRARDLYDESSNRIQQSVNDVLNDQAPLPFGGSVFANVLAAIAQGMGTYSAAINKTENFAMKAINAGLERENQRWQQNLLMKKYKVSQLKDLNTDQWHDYQTQRTERQAQQRMLIDHELQQQASLTQNAKVQQALGLMLEENRNRTEELNAERERLMRGKVMNETVTDRKITQGSPVDEKTYQAYMKGEPHKGLYGRAAIDTTEKELESVKNVLGLNFDPNSATPFTPKPGAPDLIARNPITGSALGQTMTGVAGKVFHSKEEEEKMKEAFTRLQTVINAKLYMVSGAQINEQEAQRTAEEFKGMSREDQIRNLNMLWNGLQNKKADLEATYPGMGALFNSRRPQVTNPYDVDNQFKPGIGP